MPNLTIYLLREDFPTPASAIEGVVSEHSVELDGVQLGTLFVQNILPRPPTWVKLFEGLTDTSDFNKVQSTSALYITSAGGRLFAIAFGHGRHIMKSGAYEDRFGLLVVINSLKSDELRSIDKRTFDTVDQNVRAQVSQRSPATEFGIDIEKDLIRGITGQPTNPELGTRMTGADALTVAVDADIADLGVLLEKYLEAFQSDEYKTSFGWIDQIHQVNDNSPTKALLDEILVQKMDQARQNNGSTPGLWLAIPDVVDYAGIHRFRFTGSGDSHNDLHLPGFIKSLADDEPISVELLKRKLATAVDEDGHDVGDRWQVYKCIHLEVEQGEDTFLLATGKWFKIKTEFTNEIEAFYTSIPMKDLEWPNYQHSSEGAYNEAVFQASAGIYALMDAIDIPVGGIRDKIEFCDLYSQDRELIHVKRYGASSLLGHLFNQGLVSGQHLRSDPKFLNAVNDHLPNSHKFDLADDKVPRDTQGYKVTFAIISEYQGNDLHIPFFAKVAFKHVCQRLQSFGFTDISRAKITVDEVFSKTEKAKKKAKKDAKKQAAVGKPEASAIEPTAKVATKKQVYKAEKGK